MKPFKILIAIALVINAQPIFAKSNNQSDTLTFSQKIVKNASIALNAGNASYVGDLKNKAYTWNQSSLMLGVNFRKEINNWLAYKIFINYSHLKGDDKFSTDKELLERNLSFKTSLMEIGAQAEFFYKFKKKTTNENETIYRKMFPFFNIGINAFHFNPKALYNGSWTALQPLSTEGQGTTMNATKPYSKTQIAIPIGVGLAYQINSKLNLSLEFAWRKTFTDYIDDVSSTYVDMAKLRAEKGDVAADLSCRTDELAGHSGYVPTAGQKRGTATNKDWYIINSIGIRYQLGK